MSEDQPWRDYMRTPPSFVIEWPDEVTDEQVVEANRRYIERFEDDPWYEIIAACDREMQAIDPHYRIDQIKEKFWGLRYYFTPSDPTLRLALEEPVRRAELAVDNLEKETTKP